MKENGGGRRKKKREILGPPFGAPTLQGPLLGGGRGWQPFSSDASGQYRFRSGWFEQVRLVTPYLAEFG